MKNQNKLKQKNRKNFFNLLLSVLILVLELCLAFTIKMIVNHGRLL